MTHIARHQKCKRRFSCHNQLPHNIPLYLFPYSDIRTSHTKHRWCEGILTHTLMILNYFGSSHPFASASYLLWVQYSYSDYLNLEIINAMNFCINVESVFAENTLSLTNFLITKSSISRSVQDFISSHIYHHPNIIDITHTQDSMWLILL